MALGFSPLTNMPSPGKSASVYHTSAAERVWHMPCSSW